MRLLALALALLTGPAVADSCREIRFESQDYAVCEVQAGADLRLFLGGDAGIYGGFAGVQADLGRQGLELGFAMNAGMFHPDLSPVGLYVEAGRKLAPLVTSAGPGNFGMLPNGVFCIGDTFAVVESRRFAKTKLDCTYATQSGPMLVIGGALHPQFKPGSDSLHVRNGVGVSADGRTAYFVLSERAVNFDTFARLFRDGLQVPDALYLDGSVSRLYAPELGRSGSGFQIGPMVGLVVPRAGG